MAESRRFITTHKYAEANRLTRRLFQLETRVDELELKVEEISEMMHFLMIREAFRDHEPDGDDEDELDEDENY